MKRIHPELEKIIERLSEELSLMPSTIRNVALLYGLILIFNIKYCPREDEEFFMMLNNLKSEVYGESYKKET